MHYGAPGAVPGHGLDSPNLFALGGNSANSVAGANSPVATPVNITSDANKVSFFTPRFSPGFQFGLSYTPDTTDVSRNGTGATIVSDSEDVGQENVIEVGVNLVRAFGDASVS